MFNKEMQFWKIGEKYRKHLEKQNQQVKFDEDDIWDDYISPYAKVGGKTIDSEQVKRNNQLQSDNRLAYNVAASRMTSPNGFYSTPNMTSKTPTGRQK